MAVLRPEMLTEIGTYLVLDDKDRKRAQVALYRLCRANKTFCDVFLPLLYQKPTLRTTVKASRWAAVVNSAQASPDGQSNEKGVSVKSVQPVALCVLYPRSTTDEWTFPSGWLSESKRTKSKPLPDLQKALVVGVFNQVTSLKLVNVYVPPSVLPTLLGPGKAVRRNLQSFALYSDTQDLVSTSNDLHFLLEALQFFASEPEFVTDYPDQKPEFADRYPEGCDSDAITKTLLSEAHTDYSLFSKLFNLEWADWDGPLESYFERAQPRDISPWSSLKILDLQLFSSLALALIIYSPAFPVLRRLIGLSVGSCSHSVVQLIRALDTPGTLLEPELEFESGDPDVPWMGFGPPSKEELDKEPPFIGPKLSFLDMSRLTVMLPW